MSLLTELLTQRQDAVIDDEQLEVLVDEMNDASDDLDDIVAVNTTLTDAVVALESLVTAIEANPELTPTSRGLLVDRANRILTRVGADELVLLSMEEDGEDSGSIKTAILDRIKKITEAAKNSATKVLEGFSNFWDKIGKNADAAGRRAAQLQEQLKGVQANDFEFQLPAKYKPASQPAKMTGLLKSDNDKIFDEYARGIKDAFLQLTAGQEVVFRFKSLQPSQGLPGEPHFVPVGSVAKLEWSTPDNGKDPVTFNITKSELDEALTNLRAIMGGILKFKETLKYFPKKYTEVIESLGHAKNADFAKTSRQQVEQVARIMDYTVKRWTTYAGTQATLVLKVASTAMQEKRKPDGREGENKEG